MAYLMLIKYPYLMNHMPKVASSIPKLLNEQEEFEAIVSHLRQTFQFKEIKEVLLCQEIIAWHAQQNDITVKPEEIQQEADEFRRQCRLEKASDTLAWLRKEQTSTEDFEVGLQIKVLRRKLSEHLFSKKAEESFVKNQLEYDRAILYQITFSSEALACELLYRIQDQEISFFEVAHQFDTDEQRARRCGYEGEVSRWEMKPDLAAAAFGAPPGEIAGPVANDQGWHLLLIERVLPAELSPSLQQKLIDDLFRHWLEQEKLRWLSNSSLKSEHPIHTSAYST
jgi:parvulin-like peptidyl-prolyl isomerase